MQEDIKSYSSIYQLRQAFIRSGGKSDTFAGDFNKLETPADLYFRIFFHFNTGHGLLNTGSQFIDKDSYRHTFSSDTNTAVNYLYTNGELQRKQMLDDFVNLLSNINTYSPWYFQKIEGLQDALQRSEYTGEFKIDEEPRAITIKTMEDAYDNRISTLLDLYKAVAFSKIQHKEILPANLRRFDMSIYIINTPISFVHYGYGLDNKKLESRRLGLDGKPPFPLGEANYDRVTFDIPDYREWANGSPDIFASAKLIELQGCEIDANSAASAYTEVSADEPFRMNHEIKITFKNIIEQRYNDSLNRIIGDYIFMDMDRLDRESSDNVWGAGLELPWDEDSITEAKRFAEEDALNFASNPFEYDDDGNMIFESADPTDINKLTIRFMNDRNQEALNKQTFIEENGATGQITGASSIMDSYNTNNAAQKYSGSAISSNFGKSRNIPSKDKNIEDKYGPGIIGGMAQDFLRGAVGTAKSYINSAIAKITMGNLGSNLMQIGLDKTIGKGVEKAKGAMNSTLNDAKAAIRGWTSGTSIGSNISGSNTSGHRP